VAEALGLPASLVCGFADAQINHLLGLEAGREVSLSLVSAGHTESPAPPAPDEIPSLHLRTVPLSKREVDYPAMQQMHAASSLSTPEEVAAWRGPLQIPVRQEAAPLPEPIEEVIQHRGSTRHFAREPISYAQLSTILEYAARPIPADFLTPAGALLNDLYLIVNAVDGLEPGAYFYRPADRALEPLKHGDFRSRAAYLALGQDLAGDAAVAVFFLSDLNRWLARFGNRGYRAVQLEAGVLGGRVYLAAYAQHLGATGLTFYDDDVVQFFSPHAAGRSAIFLVAAGHPAPPHS
jgi:SagB-type dehydrogenase family enzyme